jgi:hypothetical protein
MPLTVNFTASQLLGTASNVYFVDASTGTDGTITNRRITLMLPDGKTLVVSGNVNSYSVWPYASPNITLALLSRSSAVSIRVDWLNASDTVVYTLTKAFQFANDDLKFRYSLIQAMAAQPSIINDANFYNSFCVFSANIDGAKAAIELASDTAAAQSLNDSNFNMILNQTKYF